MSSLEQMAPVAKRELLKQFRAEDGHENPEGYDLYLKRLFGSVSLSGKRVLEIGSGRGLLSLHCGVSGAEKVVSVEPEMEGSTSGVVETQQKRIDLLGLSNVELRKEDFHDIDFANQKFDVIVMIAVLNHLYETPLSATRNQAVFDKYVEIASHFHELLNPNGVVIATDACRFCLWTQLRRIGLPKSLCLTQKTIDWKIHQQPATWKRIFNQAGFDKCEVEYPVPYRMRGLRSLLNTSWANFALMGEFVLRLQRGNE